MENKENKVISIRLVNIIAIFIVIIAIIIGVNKIINTSKEEKIKSIVTVDSTNYQETGRIGESITSRSAESYRINYSSKDAIQENSVSNNTNEQNLEADNIQVDDEQQEGLQTQEETYEQSEDKKEETIVYTPIEGVKISEKMDLTVRTGLSREGFIELISKVKQDSTKFFYDNAGVIYDLCEKYSINEIFFCGLISAESGWNIASNHRNTYNYISLMSNGRLKRYSSVQDGLEQAAKTLHDNYLTPGGKFYHGKTLSGVKTRFCPNSSTWTSLVYGRMKQITNSK